MSKEITKIDREDFETAERAIEFDGEIYVYPIDSRSSIAGFWLALDSR